eukprot:7834243-Lingulodinium_polyedra.AAC.1
MEQTGAPPTAGVRLIMPARALSLASANRLRLSTARSPLGSGKNASIISGSGSHNMIPRRSAGVNQ